MRPCRPNLILLLLLAIVGLWNPRAAAQPAAEGSLEKLVLQLDSDSFDLREAALRRLILTGPAAVDVLKTAAAAGSAEVTWRAMHAIVEIAVAGELNQRNRAEEALAELRQSGNPSAASRAESALATLPETRQTRAIAMIQSLGGRIDVTGTQLTLDDNWTGGETGLAYIQHVVALRSVRVEPTAPITDPALRKLTDSLAARQPAVKVTLFGSAFMGVGAATEDGHAGMQVITAPPDTPAGKAGIKPDDIITAIDKAPINSFDDLVMLMRRRKAGDEVEVEFTRPDPDTGERKPQKVKVTLGSRPKNLAQ
jgi:hypothetical protein